MNHQLPIKKPTVLQTVIAKLTRLYPLYSGCGTLANHKFLKKIAGTGEGMFWSSVPGGEVLGSLNDYDGRSAFFVGALDRKINWICQQLVKEGDTVLDIGANIGLVMLKLSSLAGSRGRVYAFEPNPPIFDILEETVKRNHSPNVSIFKIALGSEPGKLELRIPRGHAGKASFVRNRKANCDLVEVPVVTLSDFVRQEGITEIRLIKIDVEGFEAEVLQGGYETLKAIRPEAILFEMNETGDKNLSKHPVFKILDDFGYRFFSVPKCMFSMHLRQFDPSIPREGMDNDFLAVPEENYEKVSKIVNAKI